MLDVVQDQPVSGQEQPVKKRAFPVRKDVNWDAVKGEFLSIQFVPKEIAQRHGITLSHLYHTARRRGWERIAPNTAETVKKAAQRSIAQTVAKTVSRAQPAIEAAVREWQERVLGVAERAVVQTGQHLTAELDVDSLKTAVSALDVADRVGRRALGLDREATGSGETGQFRFALGVRLELISGPAAPDPVGPVIDVSSSDPA